MLITGGCDNHCVFCGRHGLAEEARDDAAIEADLIAARGDADEVSFVGGEPTLERALERAIGRARALGFVAIGLQSHGRHLAAPGALAGLVDAGLTDLHLSIHGPDAAIHDHHVGVAGAHARATEALQEARRLGLRVVVLTVLTRSNFRHLAAMPDWLVGHGVAAWTIAAPRAAGRALLDFERVIPRLGMALPHALHALEVAARRRLPAWIEGAPHCLLGPYRGRDLGGAARSFAAACEGCPARDGCPGVDPVYLARFAGDELGPAQLRPTGAEDPRLASEAAALRRIFVGPGALATALRPLRSIVDPPRSAASRAARGVEGPDDAAGPAEAARAIESPV
ncbi:MAG: radical SAM protein [Nannocystaceae bacterium]